MCNIKRVILHIEIVFAMDCRSFFFLKLVSNACDTSWETHG